MRYVKTTLDKAPKKELSKLTLLSEKPELGSQMYDWLQEGNPSDVAFLAIHEDKVVGWSALHRWPWLKNYTIGVFVNKKYRRQGIGTKLLQKAQNVARNKHKGLRAVPWNVGGYKFYRKTLKDSQVSALEISEE